MALVTKCRFGLVRGNTVNLPEPLLYRSHRFLLLPFFVSLVAYLVVAFMKASKCRVQSRASLKLGPDLLT